MNAGIAYSKRFAGGFQDLPAQTTDIDQQFLNAVEVALLQLIGVAPTADGQVAQWDNANTRFGPALLLNKNIDPAAAIAKSKLDLTGANGIVNADIAGAAAIARSKLDFGSGLADADIAAAAAIALSKTTFPVGAILQYGGVAVPSTWVLCDGTSYLRADGTHDALFSAIGTTYGSVDGTHFTVPDLRGRVPVGLASGGKTEVAALGNNEGLAEALRNISHHHAFSQFPQNAGGSTAGGATNAPGAFVAGGGLTSGDSDNTDKPAYLVVNYIIKL